MPHSDFAPALHASCLAIVLVLSAVFGAAVLSIPASAQSTDGTAIGSCTTISESGRYVLTADVQDSDAGTCIEIRADDVVLDGNGHVIDGQNDTDSLAGVSATSQSNVVVTNVEVSDWQTGINYTEVTGSEVSSVTARSNGNGIELAAGSENALTNNTVTNNGNGIYLHAVGETSADENTLADNAVLNNTLGITFTGADNNTVTNNAIRDSNIYGLSLLFSKSGNDYNTFENNVVTGSTEDGVCLLRARHNTFENTTVEGSGRYDVYAVNGSTDNRMDDLSLTSAELSITLRDVSLDAVDDPPATPPAQGSVGYVNATDTSTDEEAYLAVDTPDANGSEASENATVYEYSGDEWTPIGDADDGSTNVTDLGEPNTHHVLAFVGESFVSTNESANATTAGANGENAANATSTTSTTSTTPTTSTSTATTTADTGTTADSSAAETTADETGTTANDSTATGENQGQATETSGPGFGLVAAVLAVLSIALLAARRR